jgi:hypothetical protein
MKTSALKLIACALAASALPSCSTCEKVADTVNEWGCIPAERPQWRPAYGWRNAEYFYCAPDKPAPAGYCRAETR